MSDLATTVSCDADLEAAVGGRPATSMLKSIDHLDDHCRRLLSRAPLVVVGARRDDGTMVTLALGGDPGVATPTSPTALALGGAGQPAGDPLADPEAHGLAAGTPTALIALVPGYGETLRVNGRLRCGPDAPTPHLDVDEAFLHCAKAILRSELWTATSNEGATPPPLDDPADLLDASPFVLVASVDGADHADISPKGDPAGLVRRLDATTIALADRPGNRRTDTLHNLMDRPEVSLLALVPGSDQVVEVRGRARVSIDPDLLESMRLRGRTPKAAIVIEVDHEEIRTEAGLVAARLWDESRRVDPSDLPPAATIWRDHVRANGGGGLAARVATKLVSERIIAAGLARDYRDNL